MTELSDIFLTHYYSPNTQKLASLTALLPLEQNEIVNALQDMAGIGFNRFKKYNFYQRIRRETEEWLFNEFKLKGGCPLTQYPIYFVVGENKYMSQWYGENTLSVQYSLLEIPEKEISFTLNDSLMTYILPKNHQNRKILTRNELINFINTTEEDDCFTVYSNKKFIEAQVWHNIYMV